MGATNTEHRPLVSGLGIASGKIVGGQLERVESGTLTGVATRELDKKERVLVTCQHVVAGLSVTD